MSDIGQFGAVNVQLRNHYNTLPPYAREGWVNFALANHTITSEQANWLLGRAPMPYPTNKPISVRAPKTVRVSLPFPAGKIVIQWVPA